MAGREKVSESKHGGPIKESSLEFWANHINRFIVPTLGAYRMDCVDTALVEKQRDAWKALGLTAPSVNKVLTTLSAIFDKQIALRTIRFNPVSLAERMARGSNEVGENDEIDIEALGVRPEEVYGPDQILKLIQAGAPGFAQTILTTFSLTGVRHGEGLGLMWRDIDFEKSEITIRRNWSGFYRDGDPVFFTPKTKHSIRRLRIPAELCLALKKWKLQCPPSKWDLVFPKVDGRPQDRKATWRAFDATIKKANENAREDEKLRRLTIHQPASQLRFNPSDEWDTDSRSERHARPCQRQHHARRLHSLHSKDANGIGVEACSGDFQWRSTGSP